MSENQKNDSKKSFLQRNLFLIVISLIIITLAGGYLYRNNLLIFDEAQFSKVNQDTQSPNIQKEITSVNDLNNKELQDKVDRLESLILELAKNVQEIPQTTIVEPEPQQITLSNDEAYELILSINQIIVNIDQQQIRNKNIQKLQNQYLFFNEEKFKELLTIPDYTYSLQQLQINENTYVQNEFMKKNNFRWLKRIIENIFEIRITKNSLEPLPSFINAMYNRQYTKAIIEYEKLNLNQKIFFKSSYELAQIYNDNQIFLENMI